MKELNYLIIGGVHQRVPQTLAELVRGCALARFRWCDYVPQPYHNVHSALDPPHSCACEI